MSAFEIRGKVAPCTLFRPLTPNLEELTADVDSRLSQTPEFFRNMAVIVDLSGLGELRESINLQALVRTLREKGLTPVGIQGGNEYQERLAPTLYLGIFPTGKQASSPVPTEQPACPSQEKQAMLVEKPVRSGQQVYAKGRDLIVLAPVGPGAEVIADGNVHIYAPLRGRALAGVMGNENARIFCKELRADLISVAGFYQVSEDLPGDMLGRQVQVRLDGHQLLVEAI
ncbi:septum site-determining protein MinC [Desulfonatronum sp. SC1]|uniref:septum site-determining protein MinC n=1 Tax=Desulfonatronum sp. SC1 TaxID=2109626 RepID=UPI000D31C52A|nr:septum site-determining protein MinC [Desulfonatronum sp. SC1]PTN34455.1 septum site-determining protein MinC [Desulfonatronum sp. SC1]